MRMTNISNVDTVAHHPYFYNNIQSGNEILISIEENNMRNYHLVNYKTGEKRQISFEEKINDFSASFINENEFIVDDSNNKIYKFNINTNKKITLLDIKDESWIIGGPPSPNKNGTKVVFCLHEKKSSVISNVENTWEKFLIQSRKGLRSRLMVYDIEKDKLEELIDSKNYLPKNQWINHPQFSSKSDSLISYCHEGLGGTVKDRIWLYDLEKHEYYSVITQETPKQIISHEFFYKKEQKIGYVKIESDSSANGKLCEYDIEKKLHREICQLPRCSHFITDHCDKFIIADESLSDNQIMDSNYKTDNNNSTKQLGLFLVRIVDGYIVKIGEHNSSMRSYGNSQDAHAHPLFTKDNKNIIFTSDFSGKPQVYITNIEKRNYE